MGSIKFRTRFLKQLWCIFTFLVLFIFLTDVHPAAAASLSGNVTLRGQQHLTENHPELTSLKNDDYQQQLRQTTPKKTLLQNVFGLPHAFGNLAGNVLKGTADVLDNINPLKYILPQQNPTTTVTHARAAADKADSFQKENKQQTTAIIQTRTTIAPPAGGHGRGVPAVLFNIQNIFQNILKVMGAILHWTQHPEPGYIISTIQSSLQSVEALKDIYLQRHMEGGIGDIPKHVEAILKNIGGLMDTATNNNPGKTIQIFLDGQALIKNIGKLEGDFIESPSTTAAPGGIIGNILQGIGVFGKRNEPHTNQNITNNTSPQQRYGEFGKVVQNTGKLVHVLGDIEKAIQDRLPNSILLQIVGKLKDLVELSLTNNTSDNENILDVIQKVWFPDSTLTQIIENFGKTLTKTFPNSNVAQVIGNILQQKIIIDLGLNIIVRSASFLRFGNIKDFLLKAVGSIENEIIGDNLNRLLAGGIGALEKIIETFERLLKPIIKF